MPTKFENKCYEHLKKIPKGKVTTYKELAIALGMKPIYDNINSDIIDDYLKRIEEVYFKIRECEDTLNDDIIIRLIKFWNLKENSTIESIKSQLQNQFSKEVVSLITDFRLKILH